MTTPRTISHQYASDPDVVAALLVDPEFLRQHAVASGGTKIEIAIESKPDGVLVSVAHDLEVELPNFIKRVINPKNRVSQKELWRRVNDCWESDFEVKIGGVPSEVTGHTSLKRAVEGGCVHEASFEVRARLPLIGSLLEGFVADQVEESIRSEFKRNADALQR